ncbi:MAG: SpoIIE family protein phosphatase [Pseudomonadota bacterium]
MSDQKQNTASPWPWIYRTVVFKRTLLQIASNGAGLTVCLVYFFFFDWFQPFKKIQGVFLLSAIVFVVFAGTGNFVLLRWQGCLLEYVNSRMRGADPGPEMLKAARLKLLNIPFFCSFYGFCNWVAAALLVSTLLLQSHEIGEDFGFRMFQVIRSFMGVLISGLTTSVVMFFSLETLFRKTWPHFFPEGGLTNIPRAFRVSLRKRTMITFALSSILPLYVMGVLSYTTVKMAMPTDPAQLEARLLYSIIFIFLVGVFLVLTLSRLFGSGIVHPIEDMARAMEQVEKGDFDVRVGVSADNELGTLAESFNRMIVGLRERYNLKHSLALAMEVQQSLLPSRPPLTPGFQIWGRSLYCDETGGDYYDFFERPGPGGGKTIVAVGDVSEHGIPSALLMASARAMIRQRLAGPGALALAAADINRQLTRDIEDSGRFMTLFLAQIDPETRMMDFLSAGHDPALLFDPRAGSFREVGTSGISLGIIENFVFTEDRIKLESGQIVVIGTDGIWEARNQAGEMFGKERLKNVIKNNREKDARDLVDAVIAAVEGFRGEKERGDDVTLAVIKAI